MSTLRLEDLKQYSDVLRTRQGEAINVRFVEPRDTEELQHYFRSLSTRSRYNRFFGAMSELPKGLLSEFLDVGARERFTVVATKMVDGFETIVAEARYAFHAETSTLEFGLSVDDRWQGHGIAHRADEESRMPRRRAWRRAHVRRHAALQRDHDFARAQIRFRLRQSS